MRCVQCGEAIFDESSMKLINADGDFVCCEECKKLYENDRDHFFNNLHNDNWYHNYMYT